MYSRNEIRERLTFSIPAFWQNILEVKNIHDRFADEQAIWWNEFYRYVDSRSPLSADSEYLQKWEIILGIPIDLNKSLGERRSVVVSKLRGIGTVTPALVKSTAESYEFGEVEVIEGNGEVTIQFISNLGVPPNLSDIQQALRDILPAHLGVNFSFKFNTYDSIKTGFSTYDELTNSGWTYEELPTVQLGGA